MLYGVSLTSAVSAGVIMASIPAVVALLSWMFLHERITGRTWAAIACAASGIGLLALTQTTAASALPSSVGWAMHWSLVPCCAKLHTQSSVKTHGRFKSQAHQRAHQPWGAPGHAYGFVGSMAF